MAYLASSPRSMEIKKEYMLLPYGVATETDKRYVAEMILNEDGSELYGTPGPPDASIISLAQIGMKAKISKRSNGLYLTDLVFIQRMNEKTGKLEDIQNAAIMRKLLEIGSVPKAASIGKLSGRYNIVMDCKILGFFIGPVMLPIREIAKDNN